MARSILIVTWMCVTSIAMAAPVRMTGEDIERAMMPGALLEIDTPLHISIPVKVSTNRIVSANAGALGLTLGAQKDRGRWWADGDKLCMKWFRWFDAKPRCMVLLRQGDKVYLHEGSGESGTATLTEANPIVAVADTLQPATTSDRTAPPATLEAIAVPSPGQDAVPRPGVRFASEALGEVIAAIEPIERSPVSKLGGPVPADDAQSEPPPEPSSPSLVRQSEELSAGGAPSPPARPREIFHVTGVRSEDELTLRSGPSEYHSAVGSISAAGRNIEIIGDCSDRWCPIRHGTDVGWVNRRYLAVERATKEASVNPD